MKQTHASAQVPLVKNLVTRVFSIALNLKVRELEVSSSSFLISFQVKLSLAYFSAKDYVMKNTGMKLKPCYIQYFERKDSSYVKKKKKSSYL